MNSNSEHIPRMDWVAPNQAETFKLFAKVEIVFHSEKKLRKKIRYRTFSFR